MYKILQNQKKAIKTIKHYKIVIVFMDYKKITTSTLSNFINTNIAGGRFDEVHLREIGKRSKDALVTGRTAWENNKIVQRVPDLRLTFKNVHKFRWPGFGYVQHHKLLPFVTGRAWPLALTCRELDGMTNSLLSH